MGLGPVWAARKISPSSEFDPRTLRSIESHYTGGSVHKHQSLSCTLGPPTFRGSLNDGGIKVLNNDGTLQPITSSCVSEDRHIDGPMNATLTSDLSV